jgi:hypothetical protein
LLELWDTLRNRRESYEYDDFFYYTNASKYTGLATGSGAVVPAVVAGTSGMNGWIVLAPGQTASSESAFASTNLPFLFTGDHPLLFETRINIVEGNTNQAQPCIGFSSVLNTTRMMQATGLGPAASFSGAILYKTAGSLNWSFRTSIGTTNTDTATNSPVGNTANQVLRIEIRLGSQGTGLLEAVPFLNGLQMLTNTTPALPIKQTFAYTSAAMMQYGCYLAAGNTTVTNAESMMVDYVHAGQLRQSLPA